ncbi:MAG: hypothetical protein H6Q90_3522, partial [Deltaproteobacteria bacterium]|nr:hypothetical protein [Deltaproteobacteria bacterium]
PVDGPDLDLTTSSYALDGLSMPAMADVATGKKTYKRIRLEGTDEQHAGTGNGITGDDETTEQTSLTWDSGLSNGTPGVIATTLQ